MPLDIILQETVIDKPSLQFRVGPRVPDTVCAVIIVLFHFTEKARSRKGVGGVQEIVNNEPFPLGQALGGDKSGEMRLCLQCMNRSSSPTQQKWFCGNSCRQALSTRLWCLRFLLR